MKRTRIKMCGTTRFEDAQKAVEFGVDAVGFIFVEKSPRCLTNKEAYEVIKSLPGFVSKVGVFVDSSLEEVKNCVEDCGLTQVQLHGKETKQFCLQLREWSRSISICKAFRVGKNSPAMDISSYEEVVDSVLLDTYTKGVAGGTGHAFDWTLIDSLRIKKPLILAGGLEAGNIIDALSVVSPFAVDINSGVEQSPGIKDHDKLRAVVEMVRDFDREIKR